MKAKQLGILIVVGALAAAAGLFMHQRNQEKSFATQTELGQKLYPDFPVNEIRKIHVRSGDKEVILAKADDVWRVNTSHAYYADFKKIADFLKKLPELKALQVIDIDPADYGRLALDKSDADEDAGTVVEFVGASDKVIGSIVLGKNHMKQGGGNSPYGGGGWPDGRYILEPSSGIAALVSETFSAITVDSANWIDKTFFKAGKLKRGTLETGDSVDWTVQRADESDALTLADLQPGEVLESSKISGVDGALNYPNFSKIADPESSDASLGLDAPRIYTAEMFDGMSISLQIGTKTGDNTYPVRATFAFTEPKAPVAPEDESDEDRTTREAEFTTKVAETRQKVNEYNDTFTGWTYLMSTYSIDKLLIDRAAFIKKSEDSGDADKTSAETSMPGPLGPITTLPRIDLPVSETPPAKAEGSTTVPPPVTVPATAGDTDNGDTEE